jgi:hypothetical protein
VKYLERGGFQAQALMRLTLGLTCLLLTAFWITNFALFWSRLGWTPSSIAAYYLGSEAGFTAPRTAGSMLEVTHGHLPMMALVMLLLTHLMLFAPYSRRAKIGLVVTAFVSALLEEGSGWLVRFVHPGFAWLKLLSFVALQTVLAVLIVGLLGFLRAGSRASRAEAAEKPKSIAAHRRGF